MRVNSGNDLSGAALSGHVATDTGTSTGATATTLTDAGKAWATNAWIGRMVSTGGVYGIVLSNTATVLTIDRWYTPSTPGGSAGSTPSTGAYVILPGNAPAAWFAVTTDSTAPAATDTTLASELSGSGWSRRLGVFAQTAGVNSYTLTTTFTSADGTTRTIAKGAVFAGQNGGRMLFETAISPTATMASGDTLALTETVTIT